MTKQKLYDQLMDWLNEQINMTEAHAKVDREWGHHGAAFGNEIRTETFQVVRAKLHRMTIE